MFGTAALVGGHDVREPVHVLDGLFELKNDRAPAYDSSPRISADHWRSLIALVPLSVSRSM